MSTVPQAGGAPVDGVPPLLARILDDAALVSPGPRREMTDAVGAYTWLTRLARGLGAEDPRGMDARRADVLAALSSLAAAERVEPVADTGGLRARIYLSGDAAAMVGPVSDVLVARGARLTGVRIGEPSLEDVFLRLTGRSLVD